MDNKVKYEEKIIEGKKTKVIINADEDMIFPDKSKDNPERAVRTPKKKKK